MKNSFVLLVLLLLLMGCHELLTPIQPSKIPGVVFVEPPEGVSFISAQYEGKRYDYVDGQNGVKSMGVSFSSFSGTPNLVGFGEALLDSLNRTRWDILFYFTADEFKKNINNSTKLFYAGEYKYLLKDSNFDPIGNRGTEIGTITYDGGGSGHGLSNTTMIPAHKRSQSFKVERVYYSKLTDPQLRWPLIWLEGSFEGWMMDDKKVKGRFRIKTQANF